MRTASKLGLLLASAAIAGSPLEGCTYGLRRCGDDICSIERWYFNRGGVVCSMSLRHTNRNNHYCSAHTDEILGIIGKLEGITGIDITPFVGTSLGANALAGKGDDGYYILLDENSIEIDAYIARAFSCMPDNPGFELPSYLQTLAVRMKNTGIAPEPQVSNRCNSELENKVRYALFASTLAHETRHLMQENREPNATKEELHARELDADNFSIDFVSAPESGIAMPEAILLWNRFNEARETGLGYAHDDTHPDAVTRTDNARRRLQGKGIDTSMIDSAFE